MYCHFLGWLVLKIWGVDKWKRIFFWYVFQRKKTFDLLIGITKYLSCTPFHPFQEKELVKSEIIFEGLSSIFIPNQYCDDVPCLDIVKERYKEISFETSECRKKSNQPKRKLQGYDWVHLCEQAGLEMEICASNYTYKYMCEGDTNHQKILLCLKGWLNMFRLRLFCQKGPLAIYSFLSTIFWQVS